MPILILLGMLLVYAIISIVGAVGKREEPLTKDDLDEIANRIRGKSQEEARKIIQQYKRQK